MLNKLFNKPTIISAKLAHKNKTITYTSKGEAILKLNNRKFLIPKSKQFDLTQATIFGLNDRLTMSATSPKIKKDLTLRDEFNLEWEKYNLFLEKRVGPYFDYGNYVYYSEKNELVRYCDEYWHNVVSIASNSKLISDLKGDLSWKEIRKIFDNTTISVAGCSVGGSIIHSSMMDIRPKNIKIADKSLYKMENINRVRLNYSEIVKPEDQRKSFADTMLKNKAAVTAGQVYSIDPYVKIFTYVEGINEFNINDFIKGNKKEPRTDILIEEVDDPRIKILLRQYAKKNKIPLIMATDLGSIVQIDINRYDIDNEAGLTYGVKDSILYKSMEEVYRNPGNKKVFFKFVDCLIGSDYRTGELKNIIEGKGEIPTSTIIPQLGSTIAVAGGIVAETIARIRLGANYPKRIVFNKSTFEVKIYK